MKKFLISLALLAGCGASDQEAGNLAASGGNVAAPEAQAQATGPVEAAVATTQLTGLYEGGSGAQRNQLCVVDKGPRNAQFGLIVWGSDMQSCSGAGSAVRSGNRLTLTMGGDSSCAIDATIEGSKVTLPAQMPAGCSYYCGPRAQMTGAAFTRSGTKPEDAMAAKDLAGDSLCETTDS